MYIPLAEFVYVVTTHQQTRTPWEAGKWDLKFNMTKFIKMPSYFYLLKKNLPNKSLLGILYISFK